MMPERAGGSEPRAGLSSAAPPATASKLSFSSPVASILSAGLVPIDEAASGADPSKPGSAVAPADGRAVLSEAGRGNDPGAAPAGLTFESKSSEDSWPRPKSGIFCNPPGAPAGAAAATPPLLPHALVSPKPNCSLEELPGSCVGMMTPAVTVVSATVAPGSAPTGVGAPDMPRIAGSINGMAVLAPAAGAAESPAGMGPSKPSAGVGSEVISGSGPSAESALGRGRLDTVESDASGAITDWRSAVRSEPLSTFGTEEPPLLSGWAAASPVGGGVAEPLRPRPLPPRSRMPGVELEPSSGATASALAGGAGDGDGSN